MEDGGLSRLDAWHLENVIFRLYKVIANCYVLCTQYVQKDVLTPETWMEKDREITCFFREPQRYEYGVTRKQKYSENGNRGTAKSGTRIQ
jgi:hypothetical protein